MSNDSRGLIIACGALASELRQVLRASRFDENIQVIYLPANLHNSPEKITPQIREALEANKSRRIFVAYADCGTGGHLDLLLKDFPNVERIPGAHCYEFFAGTSEFLTAHEQIPGTFYLTDFLAKHFEALVWQGLGLDEHPELLRTYFGNYSRVLLFSQTRDQAVIEAGKQAAEKLGLSFEHRHVGLDQFSEAVVVTLNRLGRS